MIEIETISVKKLKELAESMYGDLIKGVVDIAQKKLILDMEMHVVSE